MSAQSVQSDKIQAERAWLASFNQALDSLDVQGQWSPFWAEGMHFFANFPKAEGKVAVLEQLSHLFGLFSFVSHNTMRVSFDITNGLIYHTASVSMRVRNDPKHRTFTVPSLTVLHKRLGEERTGGMEVYIDIEAAKEVLKELKQID